MAMSLSPEISALRAVGWSDAWQASFHALASPGHEPARVLEEHLGSFRLLAADGEIPGERHGRLFAPDIPRVELPAAGDWVVIDRLPGEHRALVHAVLPRRTCLSRRASGTVPYEQVIAANADLALVVCGLDHDFNLGRIERYLVFVAGSGARAAIVLSKADVHPDPAEALAETLAIAGETPVFTVSARTGAGVAAVRALPKAGHTLVVVGSSGAGKSTLVNALFEADLQRTQEVRRNDSHGRHTTTSRTLLTHPAGWTLLDTPGMRELRLVADESALANSFEDIVGLAARCRFSDCAHAGEPGCAVNAAIEDGSLDPRRLDSYAKLGRELARQDRKARAQARAHVQDARREHEQRRRVMEDEDW
jgi:ribosome biogenesis GTPase